MSDEPWIAEQGAGDNRILRLGFAVAFLFAHGSFVGVSADSLAVFHTVVMSTLRKEQIEQLTPEQQADIAALEIRKATKRQRLLRQARGSQIYLFLQGGGLAVALGIAAYARLALPVLACLGVLAAVTASEIILANRRIDALLDLYDADKEDG